MKIKKLPLILILIFVLIFFSACSPSSNNTDYGEENTTYFIKLNLNGGTLAYDSNIIRFSDGEMVELPTPEKFGYEFEGWYDSEVFGGIRYIRLDGKYAHSDIELWAKWRKIEDVTKPDIHEPNTYKVTLVLNGGNIKDDELIYSYTEGVPVILPIPEREKFTFAGWYEEPDFSGEEVFAISDDSIGDKIFYAKWTEISKLDSGVEICEFAGYEEGIFIEIPLSEFSDGADFKIEYKLNDGETAWTMLNNELIRVNENTVRADIVGIKSGVYSVKVSAGNEITVLNNIEVSPHDRSGYAHLGRQIDGVGAYNPNGTPKNNAKIIYLTEENKNSVELEISGSVYHGIDAILSRAGSLDSAPLIVRILGRVSATSVNLPVRISAASNITIEGIGNDAELNQWGVIFTDCNSIEVRNLIFSENSETVLSFNGNRTSDGFKSNNIWIHGNTFKLVNNATYLSGVSYATVSYNHFIENKNAGSIVNTNLNNAANFTFHHNFYENCTYSLSGEGQTEIHLYNNLYKAGDDTVSFIRLSSGSYAFIENCFMQNCAVPIIISDSAVKIWNSVIEGGSLSGDGIFIAESRNQRVVYGFLKTDFELSGNNFYYNQIAGESDVSVMHSAEEILNILLQSVGVHKNK